jgi:hypothetical protein
VPVGPDPTMVPRSMSGSKLLALSSTSQQLYVLPQKCFHVLPRLTASSPKKAGFVRYSRCGFVLEREQTRAEFGVVVLVGSRLGGGRRRRLES